MSGRCDRQYGGWQKDTNVLHLGALHQQMESAWEIWHSESMPYVLSQAQIMSQSGIPKIKHACTD